MGKIILLVFCCSVIIQGYAQNDSSMNKIDSFLMHQKGLLGKLARNLMADKPVAPSVPVRNDLLFMKYKGKSIRNIIIKRLDFGTPLTDTGRHFKNTFTQLASDFHHKTREDVIRNNLFFKTGDKFIPDLLADNERQLRDLPYLHDAQISAKNAGPDSVDITIVTKVLIEIIPMDFKMKKWFTLV